MNTHNLKVWEEYFEALWDGSKTFEWRKNDWDYQVGDGLFLYEWNKNEKEFTGRYIHAEIIYILHGGVFNIPNEYCILAIKPIGRFEE